MDLQSLPWYGQLLVFLLIGGIAFGIFYMVYYSDNQEKIKRFDTQIEEVEKEIKKAEKKELQLRQIKEEKEAKEKVLDKLKEILPEEKEISQILRKVQSLISTARLKIQKWVTQKEQRKEIYLEHPIAISLDGNYHNVGIFFDQLSKLKKIFTVDNLEIKPIANMTTIYSIKASFTAYTYTYREFTASSSSSSGSSSKGKSRRRRGAANEENENQF